MLAVSAGLTAATLWVVSFNVEKGVRNSIHEELRNSVRTYETFSAQRNTAMVRSARLMANLPNVRALMATDDLPTIQNESADISKLASSDLLVLADRGGNIVGLQAKSQELDRKRAQEALRTSLERGGSPAWWSVNGRMYEVWLQPIYFGASSRETNVGTLAIGDQIDATMAQEFSNIVSGEVIFREGKTILASTLPSLDGRSIEMLRPLPSDDICVQELQLGSERFLAATVAISSGSGHLVTITVIKSVDKATAFLQSLNRVLLGLGVLSVLSGLGLVFLISHTFTKPLANLVSGVRALSEGNFDFPLMSGGKDEVGEVTGAFERMRTSLQNTQSEQRALEERLRQAHKMEGIGRLAGGVAHDFNNLLTVIRGNSDLLLDRGSLDAAQAKNVEQIQNASNRAVAMTRQLLAFSRMQVLQPRVLDLNGVISEMSKMIPRLIGEDVEFTFEGSSALATVLADPGQLEQVFLNLAVNARDAMPNGGRLKARIANVTMDETEARKHPPMQAGSYVLLAVSDTGQGMDPDTKTRIFEPFFTTKEVGRGTGLGLATVYGIVKQSGGFIWVESEKGKGSTFEVYLPATRRPAAEPAENARGKSLPRGTETILVVEDEREVRELMCEFLKSGGYTVLEASNGIEALRVQANHPQTIHLLLTDIVMPGMNGTELAERFAATRPGVRALFMTGYAEFSAGESNQKAVETFMLQKPFSKLNLFEKVRDVLASDPLGNRESDVVRPV